jgi:hypothetical protein
VVWASVIVLEASATLTDATGTGETVTEEEPLWPSLVAVIVAEPGVTAVTNPLCETVAKAVLLELQVTIRPVSTLSWASFKVTFSCSPSPCTTVAVDGLTVTDATGAWVTVSVALPL